MAAAQRITIRQATPVDVVPWDLLLDADSSKRAVSNCLKHGGLWLAERKGKVVAEMLIMRVRPRTFEIMNIAVRPSIRSQGIGTKLLRKAKARASELGASRLEVGTGNNSFPQLVFYQRFGFRLYGIRRDFFAKRYKKTYRRDGVDLIDMIRMELSINK